ncbi:MAG: TIGR01777 family protein [Candidatus Omnitrophica bacterium]|nr:TIGR01777 family protein [Candidatus Omnitrophota bacterium]
MKLVITGGTGFIGRALCEALAVSGHDLTVLSRAARASSDPRIRDVEWNPHVAGAWERAVDGAHGVINFAGEPIIAARWTPAQKQRLVDSRVKTTEVLVEAIRHARQKPAVLISASAIGYYGARGDEMLDETAPAGSDFLAQLCRQWEASAQAASALGVRVVCLRIGLVMGRDGGALAKMLPPFRMGLGGPLGSGRQWMSWIHRDDLIGICRWALETPAVSGTLNATAPNPVTMREFSRTLGRALHRPAVLPVPGFVLRLLLGDMAQMLLTGQRVTPAAALGRGFHFAYPQLAEALQACVNPAPRGSPA